MAVWMEFRDNGAIMWHADVVTGDDIIEANREMNAHDYPNGFKFQLIELTAVTSFDVTTEHMKELAYMDQGFQHNSQHYACVVAPSDFVFALSRTWNQYTESDLIVTNVVRSRELGLAWLLEQGIECEI